MNAKLLALVAFSAAVILGAVLLLTDSGTGSETASGTQDTVAGSGNTGPESAETAGLSEVEALEGGDERVARLAAGGAASSTNAGARESQAPGASTVEVLVEWPEGATPTSDLVLYALPARVPGNAVQRVLASNTGEITFQRHTSDLFDGMEGRGEPTEDYMDRLHAEVPVSPFETEGRWGARIELPPGVQRTFVHAFGGGFGTGESVEARVDAGPVTIRPVQRASLVVVAETDVAGMKLPGSYVRLELKANSAAMMSMGSSKRSRYRADRGLDESSQTEFVGVTALAELELQIFHDELAPYSATLPALQPGESRQVTAKLVQGLQITGRVVDGDGAGVAGSTVTAALPGQAFGFDDEVLREAEVSPDGTFSLRGLPGVEVIVRAEKTGALQSERVRIDPSTSPDAKGLLLTIQEGKSIAGEARLANGEPAAGLTVRAAFDLAHLSGPSAFGAVRGAANEGVVDSEGRFKITGLGSGPFKLEVEREPETASEPIYAARIDGVRPGRNDVLLTLRPATSVTGQCVDDLGAPVAEEWISIYRLVPGSMGDVRLDKDRTRTDGEGRFLFEGVTPGSWVVNVATDRHVTPEEVPLDIAGDTVVELVVTAVRTGTVTGLVIDPDGQPVAGAMIGQASDDPVWRRALSGRNTAEATQSAADGTFVLFGVQPGEVTLQASSDDFAPTTSDFLKVAPGATVADVTLRLVRGATIEGVCFDKEGKTASGRMITIQSMGMQMMRTLPTGTGGTFKQSGLTPGRYQVIAMDPGMDTSGDAEDGGLSAMFENMSMAMVSLEDGETEFIYLGAPPASPVKVTGKVTMGGEPQAGLMVAWMPASAGMYDKMKIATTEKDGAYEVTLDDSGDYLINVTDMSNAAVGQQRTTEFNHSVPLRVDEVERDFDLPGGVIAGRVLLPDGSSAGSVRVTLIGAGGVRTDQIVGGSYAECMTEQDGTFEIPCLQAGTYRVMAGGSTPLNESSSTVARVISEDIVLAKDRTVEGITIELTEPGEVEVTVRDAGGQPISGANVFLRDSEGRHTEMISMSVTTSSGKATIRGVSPGQYTAAARGEQTASQESGLFEVREGETATANLQLGPGGWIVATLKVKGGGDVPAASVQVLDGDGKDVTRRMGITDFQAKYSERPFSLYERRVGPLPPGRYTVTAESSDGRKAKRRVSVEASSEKTVSLVLK